MRLALGAFTAALLLLCMPLAGGAGAAVEVTDDPAAAAWGADWLAGRLEAGIPLETFGSPDWGTTLEAGLALAAVGGHDDVLDTLWDEVGAQREAIVTSGGADVPGRLAQLVLLAVATGRDPHAVGVAPGEDLVARLEATRTTAGADEGLYGSQDATYDGAYRQGYSLAALVAAGAAPDPTSVQWLLDQQCDDGSWMPHRTDLTQPCAFDGAAFVGPDSNSTGAALSGLVAVGAGDPAVGAAVDDALGWLDSVQQADGGWPFFPVDATDPNSTAVVVQALVAAGSLDDPAFTDRDGTPQDALRSFQLGCADGEDAGALTFPNTGDLPNAFATAQGVAALAGAPLGIDGPVVSVTLADLCPATTTTTTTPTTSTTTPSTTTTSGGPADPDAGTPDGGATPEVRDVSAERDGTGADPAALAMTGSPADRVARVGALMLLAGVVLLVTGGRLRRA